MDSLLLYAALGAVLLAFLSLVRPLHFVLLRTRRTALAVLMAGVSVAVGVTLWPQDGVRPPGDHMRIDDFMPYYHFNEVHTLRIQASPSTVFRAIKEATPEEVRFLRLLTRLRSLGDCHRPDEHEPILTALTDRGFLLLGETSERELVLGTVGQFWKLSGGPRTELPRPELFEALDAPGYAKATINFHVQDGGDGWSLLRTETRILTQDPAVRRNFGLYWRLIRPGSGLIRREWLRAIKRRAEGSG